MKNLTSLILLSILSINSFAYNYTISFSASGISTNIDSVMVENITTGKSVIVPSNNTLTLTDVTTSIIDKFEMSSNLNIYNFNNNLFEISYSIDSEQNTKLSIFNIEGRILYSNSYKSVQGANHFSLSLPKGIYIVKITGLTFSYKTKLIGNSSSSLKVSSISSNNSQLKSKSQLKSNNNTTTMYYTLGDQLIFKGKSGNYTTFIPDKPNSSKTIDFEFVECKDLDDNYYPVVKIGNQLWMAENLKTTKYRTGESIPKISNNALWYTLNSGACCVYENLDNNVKTYGLLYNWFAVNDIRKIAPWGWHVPTYDEMNTLATFLGGSEIAGGKLKSNKLSHWSSPNANATNETGFTALPAGIHADDGDYYEKFIFGGWWSSTLYNYNPSYAYEMHIFNRAGNLYIYPTNMISGLSIRCVRN